MAKQTKSSSKRSQGRPLAAVILAAGQGKRMRSSLAKVLHEVAGRPLILHVLSTVTSIGASPIVVVVGHQAESVQAAVGNGHVSTVLQREQLGTGHAVMQARASLDGFEGDVLVLCGDVPLLRAETMQELVLEHRRAGAKVTVLSARVEDPTGYGRIVRGKTGELRIVEDADADDAEAMIDEINTGTYCFDSAFLAAELDRLGNDNAQGEYYLTDLVEIASLQGAAACATLEEGDEGLGVNCRADLARVESLLQERLILEWMDQGVTFLDPPSTMLSADVRIGADTIVGPCVRLSGRTVVGSNCVLEGSTFLRDTTVGDGALVRWGVVADNARIGSGAKVGPYAHLRPEADLGADVHIGNFVEVKKAIIGARSKANHLAYIGDSTVGEDANIGAGTITCNYDGFRKHRTVIGDRVQIGSDTQLVAPVTVGADAYIAAGSTVTKDVEPGALVFNDKPQRAKAGWVEGFRARQKAGASKESK